MRIRRALLMMLALTAVLAAAAVAWVYWASQVHLRSFPRPPAFTQAIPTDAAAVARGEHLVRTRGCQGCHGAQLQGKAMGGHALAPNLPKLAREASATELDAAIRHGIGRDGLALYSMPAFSFIRLSDADMADLIAYLRQAPLPPATDLPAPSLPWRLRLDLARGLDGAVPKWLPHVPALQLQGASDQRLRRGEYTAMTTCIECHGFKLHADYPWPTDPAERTPDLRIIAAYDKTEFLRLMQTGKAKGDRELPMMSGVARGRFSHFNEQELDDLYTYLRHHAGLEPSKQDNKANTP